MSTDAVRRALLNPVDAFDEADSHDDDGGDASVRPAKEMPEGCPVTPVGTEDGVYYFLTALGELRGLTCDKVANKHIVGMFAPMSDYLYEMWPRKREIAKKDPAGKPVKDEDGNTLTEWVVTGWRNDDVAMLLMDVAAQQGVWNAREKVRGRGAWKDEAGGLILHAGNHVMIGGRWSKPDMYDGMVYPTQPPIPKPSGRADAIGLEVCPMLMKMLRDRGIGEDRMPRDASPARVLFALLSTWNWRRPLIDPVLLMGWLAAAPIGGALDYRPIAWITGGKAAGKTEIQKLLEYLFENGILQTPNASEAAVRQTLGQQSLPVGVDEAEADKDNRKMEALITLARLAASSQGNILRGGQDHRSTEFRATSCFLFSSILVPPLTPADKSRLGIFELERFPEGTKKLNLQPYRREIAAIGGWIRRRIVDRWPLWSEILDIWIDALIEEGGQGGRAADQFGTLRAMAHLVLDDALPDPEEVSYWAGLLGRESLEETKDEADEGALCLEHLMFSQVQLDRGGMPATVSEWVERASRPLPDRCSAELAGEHMADRDKANDVLGKIGLRVITGSVPGQTMLAVANQHRGLNRIFDGSRFADGVWSQALGRVAGAQRMKNTRIAHRQTKCTRIPIDAAIQRETRSMAGVGEEVDA